MRFERNGDGWCCSDKGNGAAAVLWGDGSLAVEMDKTRESISFDLDDEDLRMGIRAIVPISINPRGLVCRDRWST